MAVRWSRQIAVLSYGSLPLDQLPAAAVSASRTRLGNHIPQRWRRRGIDVIAGIVGHIAHLSTSTGDLWRGRDHHLHGRQAFVEGGVPDPFAAEFLCYRRLSLLDHTDVNVA
jgi:hypothetical protein